MSIPISLRLKVWFYRMLTGFQPVPKIQCIPVDPDPILGSCTFNGLDAYDCSRIAPTPHSPNVNFASHLWIDGDAPTDRQKAAFAALLSSYEQLWPSVARTLVELHPALTGIAEVEAHLSNRIAVIIGEYTEDSLELIYEFDLPDEGSRCFFLRICGNEILEAVIAV
ncbi:hypothetical protein [Roseiconus lacunae]|uniref:Uncharacterized protein n=1 Tax=Roseiconus lacunae TaxID=2605694 RepID=A0ABT7PSE6_9BACT|nr:hypothetical protein [Roseiconus lacunae]MDM4019435.1 hypothetical protein [Roseiconus lacunae]